MTANTYKPGQIPALYARLSQEDTLEGDSNSIVNQKAVLSKYAADNGFSNPVFFIDDGVSGVTFDRPNFNRMIAEIEAGNVATVIVKDMSRLGRDYLKVGYYTEIFFVERDVRYIAINDGVDSAKGDNDFYAKDTSKKVRAIKRAQGQAGEHLTKPPYGYMVSPTDKKQWIVDEEAAAVVKRIFDLCIGGKGPMQIAKILKESGWRPYIPLFLYSFRWNIEVSYYEQKSFWSLCAYMVRSRRGIETLVNLINISYCAMKLLPYMEETMSQYRGYSVQEFRFALSEQIRRQIFYVNLVQYIETHIKSMAVIKALRKLCLEETA